MHINTKATKARVIAAFFRLLLITPIVLLPVTSVAAQEEVAMEDRYVYLVLPETFRLPTHLVDPSYLADGTIPTAEIDSAPGYIARYNAGALVVVLNPSQASAETLSDGALALRALRNPRGPSVVLVESPGEGTVMSRSSAVLDELRARHPTSVEGIGRARTLEFRNLGQLIAALRAG